MTDLNKKIKFNNNKLLKFELLSDGRTARIIEEYIIELNNDKIIIPVGFETDFASVPRIFWFFIPPWGRYSVPAVIHDFLYKTGEVSRKKADKIFKKLMEELNINPFKINIIYSAVRIWGWIEWDKERKKNNTY